MNKKQTSKDRKRRKIFQKNGLILNIITRCCCDLNKSIKKDQIDLEISQFDLNKQFEHY